MSNSPGPLAAASLGIKDLGAAWDLGKRNKFFPRLVTMVWEHFLSCSRRTANPAGAAGKAAELGWKR